MDGFAFIGPFDSDDDESVFQPDLDQIHYPRTGLPNNGQTLDDATRKHILQILDEVQLVIGGRHGAATRLGVPRTTLISKMRRLGIGSRTDRIRGVGATSAESVRISSASVSESAS